MTLGHTFTSRLEAENYLRTHEEAHKAAAGDCAIGDIQYKWERGPNGYSYTLCGSLQLEAGINPAQPEASLHRMEEIARCALAPATPSKHDHLVAKTARYMIRQIRKGNFPRFSDILKDYQDCYACAEHYGGTFCAYDDERQERKEQGRACSQ
jgi:hypothetical protein